MSRKNKESELDRGGRSSVPILEPGIGTRIKAAADAVGSRVDAARAAGISDDMLYRYIREDSLPGFEAIVGLARAAGFSIEWMASGRGPQEQAGVGIQEQAEEYVTNWQKVPPMERARRASAELQEVIDEAGYEPDIAVRQAILTAMFRYGLPREGAADMLEFFRPMDDDKKG